MKEFKGTKGEWKVIQDETYPALHQIWNVVYGNEIPTYIARTCYAIRSESNAQLIAAAPDLLEACLNLENDNNSIPAHAWELIQKAINKALGE